MKDVYDALFDMEPFKAPSIDGFSACFYQKGWKLMKDDLFAYVNEAFNIGRLLQEVSTSLVVPILKVSTL